MVFASALTALAAGLMLRSLAGVGSPSRRGERALPGSPAPDLDVSPTQFYIVSVGAGLVAYLLTMALTSLPVVALVPGLCVAGAPRAFFVYRHGERRKLIEAAWPDALRDLLSSVRSGSSLTSAIAGMAVSGPEPLRSSFDGFETQARSLGVTAALERVRSELADPTSDRVIEVLIVAAQQGGSAVPEILGDLARATTQDIWAAEQVRSEALEQKINSRVVFVMPWLVLVALTAKPGPFRAFYSTPVGVGVVVAGAVASLGGLLVASRIGRMPTEPRVWAAERRHD